MKHKNKNSMATVLVPSELYKKMKSISYLRGQDASEALTEAMRLYISQNKDFLISAAKSIEFDN